MFLHYTDLNLATPKLKRPFDCRANLSKAKPLDQVTQQLEI